MFVVSMSKVARCLPIDCAWIFRMVRARFSITQLCPTEKETEHAFIIKMFCLLFCSNRVSVNWRRKNLSIILIFVRYRILISMVFWLYCRHHIFIVFCLGLMVDNNVLLFCMYINHYWHFRFKYRVNSVIDCVCVRGLLCVFL